MTLRKALIIIVSTVVFSAFIILNLLRRESRLEVLGNHSFTIGKIIGYNKIGDHLNRSLEYAYEVKGRQFTRTISPKVDFEYCEKDIKLCEMKRFVVIYSNLDHSKSLIDLVNEFPVGQKIENPKDLMNFE